MIMLPKQNPGNPPPPLRNDLYPTLTELAACRAQHLEGKSLVRPAIGTIRPAAYHPRPISRDRAMGTHAHWHRPLNGVGNRWPATYDALDPGENHNVPKRTTLGTTRRQFPVRTQVICKPPR